MLFPMHINSWSQTLLLSTNLTQFLPSALEKVTFNLKFNSISLQCIRKVKSCIWLQNQVQSHIWSCIWLQESYMSLHFIPNVIFNLWRIVLNTRKYYSQIHYFILIWCGNDITFEVKFNSKIAFLTLTLNYCTDDWVRTISMRLVKPVRFSENLTEITWVFENLTKLSSCLHSIE